MFQGLRTVVYGVADVEDGRAWYSRVLGSEPYFDEPFYVGFNLGGYELGLDPTASPTTRGSANVIAYWGVDDIKATLKHLLAEGATERTGIQDVGEGILVATVIDPFGNVFGIIYNPHFSTE